jgi:bifunctional non-homologous end joining protein LigD
MLRRRMREPPFTHLDRVFWPEQGYTKRDLIDYYRALAPVALPHLRNRPFTLKRHYTVPRGPFEWVKDAPPELPSAVKRCPQPAKSRGGALVDYALVNDLPSLLWMVELGAVDLHVWPSRCDRPDRPDYVLFDLDPAVGGDFGNVVAAACAVRAALETLELESYPRTTGGEGLHVLVPIARRHTHAEARRFATIVAGALRLEGAKIDTKMIGHGQQVVAAYSVRPLPNAPVATPLRWDEVTDALDPAAYTLATVPERVARLGDVHEPVLHGRQRLDRALSSLAKRAGRT